MTQAWAAIAWLSGLGLQQQQASLWPTAAYAVGLVLALWVWLWRERLKWSGVVASLALLSMAWSWSGVRASFKPALAERVPHAQSVVVRGVITDWPQAMRDGARFRFLAQARLDASGEWQTIEWPLKVSWYRMPAGVEPRAGDLWHWTLRMRPARGHRNPGGVDTELRDWRDGLAGVAYVQAKYPSARLAQGQGGRLLSVRDALRQRLLGTPLPARVHAWLAALVLGDRSLLREADWQALQATGTAHLLSVSGLHITVWAGLAWAWLSLTWSVLARWWPDWAQQYPRVVLASGGALLLALAYAILSGAAIPVQRAWLMLAVVMALRVINVRWPPHGVLAVVAMVVTAWDPWAISQAGFWLSFVAVAALGAVAASRAEGVLARGAQLWRAQWRMGWVLMPVSTWWLGQVSWLGFVVNLLAIPWVTVLILPLALLGLVWVPVWSLAHWVLTPLIEVLMWLTQISGGVTWVRSPPAMWALAAMLGLWWAMRAGAGCWRWLGLVWVLPALLWRLPPPPHGEVEVWAWDVGQGSAVLVRTANHNLLFDTGPAYWSGGDAAARLMLPVLRRSGMDLDAVVLSHQDQDHIGGQASVLRAYPQAQVWSSFAMQEPTHQPCLAGRSWRWDGVHFAFVHPQRLHPGRAQNDQSCVLLVQARGGQALLPGDIGVAQEQALLPTRLDWRTDLLVAAHHGSKTSSSEAWLRALSPRWVWVQTGHDNRYQHPSPVVQARWADLGLKVHQTAQCGALRWRSDAPQLSWCERERNPHHWSAAPN